MKKLKATLFAGMLIVTSFLTACGGTTEEVHEEEQQGEEILEAEIETLEVFTTIYPLQFFAEQIGGEHVNVTNLVPVGADAHSFEPTAKAMIDVAEGDLFIYNGAGMEGFADALIDAIGEDNVKVVEAVKGIELIDYDHNHSHDHHDHHDHDHEKDHNHDHEHKEEEHDHDHSHEHKEEHDEHSHDHKEDHDHGHDDHHHHGDEDPHVWLDPILSIKLAENIKEALVELLPENKELFQANFLTLKAELEAIDEEFKKMVEEAEKDTFIVSHAGYGYWEHRYGVHQIGVTGLSPTNEPSTKQLEEIVQFAKDYNIQHIALEQNIPTRIAEVVKGEIGAEPIYIHNLESLIQEDIQNGDDYFSLMRRNIEVLRIALN